MFLVIITIFTPYSLTNSFSQSNLVISKYEEDVSQKIYFELSNETKTILDSIIYDASLNYTAFVFSNITDSGLIIAFGSVNTTLHSNESLLQQKIFDNIIIFKFHSKGNSTGYYWVRWNYCCSIMDPVTENGNGTVNYLHLLEILLILSVISIVLRRKKSIK
ncbi:MAG: hypothetical protein ACW981_00040 [Candidatus Hodarchaeales archaeon]